MKLPDTVNVLLVEDDDVCAEAFERAWRKMGRRNPIFHARNGREALDVLRGEDRKQAIGEPYIVLLDLNMPQMNGFEFLSAVRNDPSLADSTIFVVTTSDLEQDKARANEANVAGYIVKSRSGKDFCAAFDVFDQYWTATVQVGA